eukprot:4188682-Pleurochrysis_carterae.AAC.3
MSTTSSRSTRTMAAIHCTSVLMMALPARCNVEDQGPVSDLLNVDIFTDANSIIHKQEQYITHLVENYLPDGVSLSFDKTQAPAADNLPALVEDALRVELPTRLSAVFHFSM